MSYNFERFLHDVFLPVEQKDERTKLCQRPLVWYEADEDALKLILTNDETWLHHYCPQMKRPSMDWFPRNETASVKAKS